MLTVDIVDNGDVERFIGQAVLPGVRAKSKAKVAVAVEDGCHGNMKARAISRQSGEGESQGIASE